MTARPAVFLDRDGTLIEERGYPSRAEDIVMLPGAAAALLRLQQAGYALVLLTNQSAVARGLIDEEELQALHDVLAGQLAASGARLDAIYYCPHHPEGTAAAYSHACACRKPARGLLDLAVAEQGIDLARSAAIGDSPRDLFPTVPELGTRILVRSGHALPSDPAADHIAADLAAAVDWLLAHSPSSR